MIDELKKLGWHVDVIHERKHDVNLFGKRTMRSRGGRTTVIVIDPYHHVFSGTAICADEDNYCKATGRNIALARALVQIPEFRSKVPNLFVN